MSKNKGFKKKVVGSSFEKRAKEAGLLNIKLLVEYGSPKVKIAKEIAVDHNIDLIICGATGMNAVEHLIIGSVAEHIIRYANCDVLIVCSNVE